MRSKSKITIRYHHTSVRITSPKRQDVTSVGEDVEKRNLHAPIDWLMPHVMGKLPSTHYKLVKSLWKRVWKFLKTIKYRTTIWSSNSTPAYLSQENKNTDSKSYVHPNIYCSIICNGQDMEATKCPLAGE